MPIATQHDFFVGCWRVQPELNLVSSNGTAVRLETKAMQVLTCLAEHGGEVVPKEQLMRAAWADAFVTDQVLTNAIWQLRQAMKNGGGRSEVIETIPKRGYRLVAPVRSPANDSGAVVPLPVRRHRLAPWIVAGVGLLSLCAAGTLYLRVRHNATHLTDKDTIVLSDFDNRTGDTVFDDTLKTGLAVQLEQSPFFRLLSERKVNETLKLMGRPAGGHIASELTQEICQRTGSKAMLNGSIVRLDSAYVISLKAVNCYTGDVIAEAQEEARTKESVIASLDAAAGTLRSQLGESRSSLQKYDTQLERATTPSLEALKSYSLGVRTLASKGNNAALPFFKRAVELDPGFAMAHYRMAFIYRRLDQDIRADESIRSAYRLRDRVSEQERFAIDALYYNLATGELDKAIQTSELWRQNYPWDGLPYSMLGVLYMRLGNLQQGEKEAREAIRRDPDTAVHYTNLALALMKLDRYDEAEAVFRQAEERGLQIEGSAGVRYMLEFVRGDTAQLSRLLSLAMGRPGWENGAIQQQAETEAWYGRLNNARHLTRSAVQSALRNDAQDLAALHLAVAAAREAEAGQRNQARADAYEALKLGPSSLVRTKAALALARAGAVVEAEDIAASLDRDYPRGSIIQRYSLPEIRAAIALERKEPQRAIELLQSDTLPAYSWTPMYSAYLRGEAYLRLHDGRAAAREYQKVLDHRGLVTNGFLGVSARVGLARSYALQGATTNARAAFEDFLTLWKDADPAVPILLQAKSEYAKLK